MGQEKMGVENPEVLRTIGLFGGGIAGTGGVCGAFSGGIALFSNLYAKGTLEDKESPEMWRFGRMLYNRFTEITEEFGGRNCSDIVRVDWQDQEQLRAMYQDPNSRFQYCRMVVEKTAVALGEILDKHVIQETG